MDQTTQTPGSNTTTTATPTAPTPPAATATPQSRAERIAGYIAETPGLFAGDQPAKKIAEPTPAATPTANPEEALEKILKDDGFPSDIKSDGAKANWKALRDGLKGERTKSKEWETKLKEAQAELEKFKAAPPPAPADPAELAELKKQRDEYSERLKTLDLERHPGFEAHFRQKTEAVVAEIKQIGGAEHGERLAAIMKLPESDYKTAQLEEIYTKLPMVKQGQLASALRDWDKVAAERNAELGKAKEQYDKIQKIQEEQKQKAQQDRVARLTSAMDSQLAEAQKNIPLFQKRDGNEEWNKKVEERVGKIKAVLKAGTNEEGYARNLIWAHITPEVLQESLVDKQRITALEAELASLKAAKPKLGAGESPSTTSGPPADMNSAQRIAWYAKQQGAVR